MGVHRITSEAAKYYAQREKVVGAGVSLLGEASMNLDKLTKEQLEKLGDLAAKLLPHSPGYAGKMMPIVASSSGNLPEWEKRSSDLPNLTSWKRR